MPTRRRLLIAAAASLAAGCATPARPAATLGGPEWLWLDRLSWGANEREAAELQRLGLAGWREQQLRPAAWPPRLPPEVQARVEALSISLTPLPVLARRMDAQRKAAVALADPDAKTQALKAWQVEMNRLAREGQSRLLWRALHAPNQLQSQMGWFWFNHFNVFQGKANLRALVADFDEQLQQRALGRFRELLGVATFHPAMLRYLDNDQNAVGRLNENLGRELLELHTLGVDGGYTQADVLAASRALSGLGISLAEEAPRLAPARAALYQRRGLTEFHPGRHDTDPKQLLGQPLAGEGVAEVEALLDRLARHPATARHVSRRIARYLLGAEPSEALLQRLAARFLATDGRIDELLRTLFDAPEFAASLGHGFKDPLHWVVSALRQGPEGATLVQPGPALAWLARLGQPLYGRQTPDGYPLEASAWSAPGQLTTRFEIARTIAAAWPGLWREAGADQPWDEGERWRQTRLPMLSPATREVLAQAGRPAERHALWLSSPEFMQR